MSEAQQLAAGQATSAQRQQQLQTQFAVTTQAQQDILEQERTRNRPSDTQYQTTYQYLVTPPGGDTVVFTTQDAARRYIESLAEPYIKTSQATLTQPKTTEPKGSFIPPESRTGRDFFVDAPGMEGYAASVTAGLPTPRTPDDIQPGAVDRFLEGVSYEVSESISRQADAAREAKLGGDNLRGAGLFALSGASGAVLAGYDAATSLLRPQLLKNVETGAKQLIVEGARFFQMSPAQYIRTYAEAAQEHALSGTTYTVTSLGIATLGAADLAAAVKGKLTPKTFKPWNPADDAYIAVNDVATTWPEGSPEYTSSMLQGRGGVAYAMVELDDTLLSLDTPEPMLELDAPLIRYPGSKTSMRPLDLLAIANLAAEERISLDSAKGELAELNIEPDIITNVIALPIVKPDTIPVEEEKAEEIAESTPIQIVEQAPLVESEVISESKAEEVVEEEAIQSQVSESILESVSVQDTEPPRSPEKRRGGFARDEQPRTLEQKKGGTAARGRFRVVLDGRVSTVVAGGFVEALSIVSGGRGGRATVTRIS